MCEHYIATIDRGRLRIYTEAKTFEQRIPRLEIVEAMDFPNFLNSDDAGDEESAGAVENPGGRSRRLMLDPALQRGFEARRNTELLASELDTFLQNRPEATWDFAAAPSLYHAVFERLSSDTRRRLKRVLPKTMVNQGAEEVRAHFAATQP